MNASLKISKYTEFPSAVVANDNKLPDLIPRQLSPLACLRAKRLNLKETVKAPFGSTSAAENMDLGHKAEETPPLRTHGCGPSPSC